MGHRRKHGRKRHTNHTSLQHHHYTPPPAHQTPRARSYATDQAICGEASAIDKPAAPIKKVEPVLDFRSLRPGICGLCSLRSTYSLVECICCGLAICSHCAQVCDVCITDVCYRCYKKHTATCSEMYAKTPGGAATTPSSAPTAASVQAAKEPDPDDENQYMWIDQL